MGEDWILPKLGERVPNYEAQTTKGIIRFYDISRQGFRYHSSVIQHRLLHYVPQSS